MRVERCVVRSLVSWLLLCAAIVQTRAANAQGAAASVGVLRATGPEVPAELASRVDEALLRDLAGLAGIDQPTVFPANYDALQLAVGCEGETRECLTSIAGTVKTDAIVVRRLAVDSDGLATFALIYFEAGTGADPASVQATVPASPSSGVVANVPVLVRRLFGLSEPAAPAVAAPLGGSAAVAVAPAAAPAEPTHEADEGLQTDAPDEAPSDADGGGIGAWTWATLITGGVVLGVGAILGATAQSSFDDLIQAQPRTRADVDSLNEQFDSVETRGTVATVLMSVGGAALATGVVLLVLDLTGGKPARESAVSKLGVLPTVGGAVVTLRGNLGSL